MLLILIENKMVKTLPHVYLNFSTHDIWCLDWIEMSKFQMIFWLYRELISVQCFQIHFDRPALSSGSVLALHLHRICPMASRKRTSKNLWNVFKQRNTFYSLGGLKQLLACCKNCWLQFHQIKIIPFPLKYLEYLHVHYQWAKGIALRHQFKIILKIVLIW